MLELKNINKKYKDKEILNNIDIQFPDSGLIFLVGDSGAGKTSLLNIMGILDFDFSGSVILNDEVIEIKDRRRIQKYHKDTLGFVFQDYNLLNYLTVKDNILLSAKLGEKK